jgi:hypothetical protein
VNKLIKLIGERMLKDATAEDISSMSASVQEYSNMQSAESVSETSRLHKLPGYGRLQKQLFLNLMSAIPDDTDTNIRVKSQVEWPVHDTDPRLSSGAASAQEGYIDRGTVKSISKLVLAQREKEQMSHSHRGGRRGHTARSSTGDSAGAKRSR